MHISIVEQERDPAYLSVHMLRIEIIDIQQICPPILLAVLNASSFCLLKPKRSISTKWKDVNIKEDNEHVGWSQSKKRQKRQLYYHCYEVKHTKYLEPGMTRNSRYCMRISHAIYGLS